MKFYKLTKGRAVLGVALDRHEGVTGDVDYYGKYPDGAGVVHTGECCFATLEDAQANVGATNAAEIEEAEFIEQRAKIMTE